MTRPDEALRLFARGTAEAAEVALRVHEREAHDGETCMEERVNLVAFLAHRLGVRDGVGVSKLIERILDYEQVHREHHVPEGTS